MEAAQGSGNRGRGALGILIVGSAGLLALLARASGPESPPTGSDLRPSTPDEQALAGEPPTLGGESHRIAFAGAGDVSAPESVEPGDLLSALRASSPEEPRTEEAFHRALLAQAARDPEGLARAVPEVLLGVGPTCRKVAYLRVLDEIGSPAFEQAFGLALAAPAEGGSAHGVSLPEFAVGYLGERAARDPRARSVLLESVFGALRRGARDLRARAAAHVARTASELELHRLAGVLSTEEDPLLMQSFASALAENPETATVDLLFPGLGVPREPVAMEED